MTKEVPLDRRATADKDPPSAFICKLVVPLPAAYPTYHSQVASSHPELDFTVLSRMDLGKGRAMEDIHVKGVHDSRSLMKEIQQGKGVLSVEQEERSAQEAIYRVVQQDTPFSKIFRETEVLMRYPISFDKGVVQIMVVAQKEKVSQVFERIREVAPDATIASIRHDLVLGPQGLLTDRQREVFRVAIQAGYWDIPRRATLSDMAHLLNVSKSTISGTLAGIENRLLHYSGTSEL